MCFVVALFIDTVLDLIVLCDCSNRYLNINNICTKRKTCENMLLTLKNEPLEFQKGAF